MKDANLARQKSQDFDMTEAQRKRQQEVLASAANYSDAAWDIILARLQENPDLSSIIFGVEFNDDNFAARMVELVLLFTPLAGLWLKFENLLLNSFKRSLKRFNELLHSQGVSNEIATQRLMPLQINSKLDIPDAPVKAPSTTASTTQHTGSSPKKVGTRRKRFGRKGVHPSCSTIPIEDGDPEAEHKMCIKYASDADSASDDDTPVHLHAVVDWELFPTGLGWVNVIYRKDNSRKCFSRLREILHLVTRTDLMIIYGRVMTFYQDKKPTGVGLVLWGDLQVLIDSPEVDDGSDVWKNQHTWVIQSWKLYSNTGVHVLETVSGLVVHMFVDKKYPLSVNLIDRMFDHQLEISRDTVGNELTTAVQLIAFLKKQISDSRRPKVHDWLEVLSRTGPTGVISKSTDRIFVSHGGPYTPSTIIIPSVHVTNDSPEVRERTTVETILNMSPENKEHYQSEKDAIHLLLTRIGDEIYSTVDACKTTHDMWIAIERLQQGESLNIQDVKTNLFWEFGKFTSHDGETMESYYSRFYKMMNEMIRNNLTQLLRCKSMFSFFNNFNQNGQDL
ncbi:hypothetical protein Tco_0568983 [Tanacetum coccineum]